jgi:hypothetical protein
VREEREVVDGEEKREGEGEEGGTRMKGEGDFRVPEGAKECDMADGWQYACLPWKGL